MQKKQIMIRNAEIADAASIAEISQNDLGYSCSFDLVKTKLAKIDWKRESVFVAVCENQVIGYVHVERYDVLYCDTLANILGLAVSTQYRRCGAGRMLMAAAQDWSKTIHAVGVRLNSGISRSEAHEFYRSIGYDQEKQQIRFMKTIHNM